MNPLTFIPADLDYVDVPAYRFATKAVFKYASIARWCRTGSGARRQSAVARPTAPLPLSAC